MNQKIEMETRECRKCKVPFRVMKTSLQRVCSIACDKYDHGAPKRVLKSVGSIPESVTVSVMQPTRSSAPKKPFGGDKSGSPIHRKNESGQKENTGITEKLKSLEKESGSDAPESTLRSTERLIMRQTNNTLETEYTLDAKPESPFVGSGGRSKTAELVASPSMNLLDASATHLHGLMMGLHANQPPAEVKSYDPERVTAACNCAKQIYSLMRLKLDAIKFQREIMEKE